MSLPFLFFLFVLPFPGTVALRLLCLAAAFVIAMGFWKQLNPPRFEGKGFFALWISIAMISLAFATDPAYSLGEIKNEVGYTMMALLAFYGYIDDRQKATQGAWAVVAVVAVISSWSLWFWVRNGEWQDDAGFGGVGTFVGLVLMAVPAMVLIWFWQPEKRGLLILVALAALLAAAYSRQRAFWPALGIELTLLVLLLRFKKQIDLSARRALLFIAVIAGAGLIFLVATQGARLGEHGGKVEVGNDLRLRYWPAVVARIAEQPFHGVGFGRNAMKLGHPDLVPAADPMFWHAHNLFLNYGLAMGIPGIIALILLFASLAATYWRMYRMEDPVLVTVGMAGILLLASVVLRNLTNDFFQRDVALMFWAMNGLFLGVGLRCQRSAGRGES
jgi:O-antigen ligase